MLQRATKRGKEWLLVQRFIKTENQADRRILILNGEILCVFEKRPAGKEFRANLSLGATAHPSKPTEEDWEMIHEMKPFLLKEGLLFVAIDVMQNKLIEMNVTCPSGLVDAKALYPHLALVEEWADSLEALASSRK
jgi:glutathione synthase